MHESHRPRKRFGQHFLKDSQVIEKIIHTINAKPDQNLVEIGAGLGALTQGILKECHHLHVVEIDRDCVHQLQSTFSTTQLTVHAQDALKFDFHKLFALNQQKLRIFGNLPYNISTPLLFHLLTFSDDIQDMVFMLQKEVVMRMGAKPNTADYGRLSVMIQYACHVDILFHVGPEAFSPPPKVMSSIIRLTPLLATSQRPIAQDEKLFARVVASAFQYRRKTLKNALAPWFKEEIFLKAQIDPIRRAETLSVGEFVNLSNAISQES